MRQECDDAIVPAVDLNCDLGEGYGVWRLGDDAALLRIVTSANVACGFHAGDPSTMAEVVRRAAQHGVGVGAQVSYPDRVGFGRRAMDIDPDDLTNDVLYQIGALAAFCQAAGTRLTHVKPHGALYNRIVEDPGQAAAVIAAISAYDASLPLMTLAGGAAAGAARVAGLPVIAEGYADRAYDAGGRLVSRRVAGAVLLDVDSVAARAVRMVTHRRVETLDGFEVSLDVDSLCVHGDTPGAVELARAVRAALQAAGVEVRAFG